MTCDSCGAKEPMLYRVHRVYPAPSEGEGTPHRLDEVEAWCYACCTHYPHEPA